MGGETTLNEAPKFRVRAAGSFEQKPGCPDENIKALSSDRLARLCLGECYHPSDTRRAITRIEVVRIRPQNAHDEPIAPLIEDPWRVLACGADAEGCIAEFSDPEFADAGRDTLYYVRAIEASSPAVAADPLGCIRDEKADARRSTSVSIDPTQTIVWRQRKSVPGHRRFLSRTRTV